MTQTTDPRICHIPEPEWTKAESDEILRRHIIIGLTISEAKWEVFCERVAEEVVASWRTDP